MPAGLSLLTFFYKPQGLEHSKQKPQEPRASGGKPEGSLPVDAVSLSVRDVCFATSHLHGGGDPAEAGSFVLGVEAGRVAGPGTAPGLGSGPSATRENPKGARPLAGRAAWH